jgi:hypothetical protein
MDFKGIVRACAFKGRLFSILFMFDHKSGYCIQTNMMNLLKKNIQWKK